MSIATNYPITTRLCGALLLGAVATGALAYTNASAKLVVVHILTGTLLPGFYGIALSCVIALALISAVSAAYRADARIPRIGVKYTPPSLE